MRKLIVILLYLSIQHLQAQTPDPKLPTILPPTPEAAAITKNAELSAGKYNGALQTSVPLTQIKMKGFALPVSLGYASNGTKLDELPSREGMNWSLDAGGVITRIVNGKPDDLSTLYMPTTTLGATTHSSVSYSSNLSNASYTYDAEPDEFRIAAPGLSGKFVLDTNKNPILIPYSNLKIQITSLVTDGPYNEIIVTNTEGVKYFFGGAGAVEVTTDHSIGGKLSGFTQVNTGFFLRKIELLNRDSINFYYSVLGVHYKTGTTQTVLVDAGTVWGSNGSECDGSNPSSCPIGGTVFSSSVSDVAYNSLLLDSIKASNSARILFSYQLRPDSSDKRLLNISVYEGDNIKKYKLLYDDPDSYTPGAPGSINRRFFLKELQTVSEKNAVGTDTLKYRFEYLNWTTLPERLSYSQDHYGYFNGNGNQTMLPLGYGPSDYGGYANADREPDGNAAMTGMLNKITYPTGGNDSIIFGANTYLTTLGIPNTYPATTVVGGQGSGASGIEIFTSDTMHVKRNHMASISYEASVAPSCTDCTTPEEGVDRIVEIRVKNLTDNTYNRRILYEFGTIPLISNSWLIKLTRWK